MQPFAPKLVWLGVLHMVLLGVAGCQNTDEAGGSSVSGSVYYGAGYYDTWYEGGYYDDPDIIVTPPSDRPESPPRPTHPIARPPAPRPTPMPSIPSTPRVSPRMGGGRR
jgi:hypothetical protein